MLIAGVAEHPQGCYEIGRSQAIEHLVVFLIKRFPKLTDDIKSAAASALWKLSQEPVNAANLFKTGVVPVSRSYFLYSIFVPMVYSYPMLDA